MCRRCSQLYKHYKLCVLLEGTVLDDDSTERQDLLDSPTSMSPFVGVPVERDPSQLVGSSSILHPQAKLCFQITQHLWNCQS